MYCPHVLGWGLGSSTKARLCRGGNAPSWFCVFTDSGGPSMSPINWVALSVYPIQHFPGPPLFALVERTGEHTEKIK